MAKVVETVDGCGVENSLLTAAADVVDLGDTPASCSWPGERARARHHLSRSAGWLSMSCSRFSRSVSR